MSECRHIHIECTNGWQCEDCGTELAIIPAESLRVAVEALRIAALRTEFSGERGEYEEAIEALGESP